MSGNPSSYAKASDDRATCTENIITVNSQFDMDIAVQPGP